MRHIYYERMSNADTFPARRPSRPTRRQQFSATTKAALVDVAEKMFTEHGYAGTSLDAVVAGADVTKGALYHHFSGKQALFEAVFERIENDAAQQIQAALPTQEEPWAMADAGLRALLSVMQDARYRRIVIQEGPAVLGYERYREQEERSAFNNVLEIIQSVLTAGTWELDEDMKLTFSRIFFGAITAAGASIAASDNPEKAADNAQAAIGFILAGIKALTEVPVDLPAHLHELAQIGQRTTQA